MLQQNCSLILASQSRVRRKILQDVGLKFDVIKPIFDEDGEKNSIALEPQKLAIYLAQQKALSISKINPNHYVIGSDQVCEFLGKEVFKSIDRSSAIFQLAKFNGQTHYQNNAVVIAKNNQIIFENLDISRLTMRNLLESEIESYVSYDKPWGCAGSYKYESMGKHLFANVSGDYYGILGLSIQSLLDFLHKKKLLQISKTFDTESNL